MLTVTKFHFVADLAYSICSYTLACMLTYFLLIQQIIRNAMLIRSLEHKYVTIELDFRFIRIANGWMKN